MRTAGGWASWQALGISISLALLIAGCAKSVYPPGGPVDKTPAKILTSYPATGSTHAPLDSAIVISLSKPLDNQTVIKALFISPRLDPDPKIKIHGRSIVIAPKKPLAADKTYVITLGSDIRDTHGVGLGKSVSVAFSTGAAIDSGAVRGTIYKDGKPAAGISLALLESTPEEYKTPIDSIAPDYLMQSGQDGTYAFQYLPQRSYFLIAFDDKNKNRRINPRREMVGLPFVPVELTLDKAILSGIDIRLQMIDSGGITLRSVSVNADRLLKIRFDKGIGEAAAKELFSTVRLYPTTDTSHFIRFEDYTNLSANPSTDFVAKAALDSGQNYRISFDAGRLYPALPDSLKTVASEFTNPNPSDLNRPTLLERFPIDKAQNLAPDTTFKFRFSEPMDSVKLNSAVHIVAAEGDTIGIQASSQDLFTWLAKAQRALQFGHAYKMLVNNRQLTDLAGNSLADSVDVLSFSTMGKDTLGRLSGDITFSVPADAAYPVILTAAPVRDGVKREVTISPGQRNFDLDLFPGYYILSAFLDRNQSGQYDYGTILPYRLAEPFSSTVDTFRVRSRFESTGALLKF